MSSMSVFYCVYLPHILTSLSQGGVITMILPPTEKWSSSVSLFPGLSFPAQILTVQFLHPERRNEKEHVNILKERERGRKQLGGGTKREFDHKNLSICL